MKMVFDAVRGGCDFALTPSGGFDGGYADGGALEAAVLVSLFTDVLAEADEMTDPLLGPDRRGWWSDSGLPADQRMGSKIWLRRRDTRTEANRLLLQRAAEDALQWLIDDGIAAAVEVTAVFSARNPDWVGLQVAVTEPNGVRRDWRTDFVWGGLAG
jgi:phage gp46-like protein